MYPADLGCLYLHGFLSSPHSQKARQLADWFARHLSPEQLVIPELPFAPAAAIALARQELQRLRQRYPRLLIIGSSLGGFYATHLAETEGIKAAVINPAVRPFALFEHYLGPNRHYYTGEVHELTAAHLTQLQQLDCPYIRAPDNLFLLLQTGDETLDYRHAAHLYRHCPGWLEGGGNHSFERFTERLPMLLHWACRQP